MDDLNPWATSELQRDDDGEPVRWRLADYCRRCMKLCRGNPHKRYYCPVCHHVACAMKRQGGWVVLPHYQKSAREHAYRNDEYAVTEKPCRGGPVDEKEDRAP